VHVNRTRIGVLPRLASGKNSMVPVSDAKLWHTDMMQTLLG
jgi:hypothetical protein